MSSAAGGSPSADEPVELGLLGARVLRLVGLIAGDRGGVECVEEVSEAEYLRYEAAAAELRGFAANDLYSLVLRAHTRFRTRSAAYGQRAAAGEMPVSWRAAFTDLLGELLNCLAAAQLFLERTDQWLTERGPSAAAAHAAFDEARRAALAESFPFRFLNALRDYVARHGLPDGRASAHVRIVRGLGRQEQAVVLELYRDSLLSHADVWGDLGDQLRAERDHIDAGACLAAMMRKLEVIMRTGLSGDLRRLAAAAAVIEEIAAPVLSRHGEPQMITMHLDPHRDAVRRVGMQPVPVDLLDLARERQARG